MKLPGLLRLEYVLVEYSRPIMVVMAVVALLSLAGLGVATLAPPTQEVEQEVHSQSISTEVDHHAVVTNGNSLWEAGTVLENREFYPLSGASNLTLRIRTTAGGAERLYGGHHVDVVYYSKVDGNRIWERTEKVAAPTTNSTKTSFESTVHLPVADIFDRMDQYNSQLTGVGRTNVQLRLRVNYSTWKYAGGYVSTTELKLSNSGYQLGSLDEQAAHAETVTETVKKPPDTSTTLGALSIVVLAAVAAGGTRWVADNRDAKAIKDEIDRRRCSEWISKGRIRQPIGGQDVMMMSLEDLTYVAIDSKERVIHDPDRGLYAIMDDGMLYYYDPLEDPAEEGVKSEEVVGPGSDLAEDGQTTEADESPADTRAPQIAIDEADSRAWNRLFEEEDAIRLDGDSADESDEEESDTRGWDQLMGRWG